MIARIRAKSRHPREGEPVGETETGRVLEVAGETARVEVRPESVEACAGCRLCRDGEGGHYLELPAPPGLEQGQVVLVELPAGDDLRAAIVVFLLPVVALIAGAILGSMFPAWLSRPELGQTFCAAVGAGFCVGLAILVVRGYDRRYRKRVPGPRIVKVIE
jgi:positive regulator of sigma E activity